MLIYSESSLLSPSFPLSAAKDGETTEQEGGEGGRQEREPVADQQRREQEEVGPPIREGAPTENTQHTEVRELIRLWGRAF